MRKTGLLVIVFFFMVMAAEAQVQRETNPSQNIATNTDKKDNRVEMIQSLNLTKEQQGQLKEFHRSMKQQKEAIDNDASLTTEQKEAKMKALHKEQKEKLNSILTPEQMEQLKEQRKNAKMNKEIPLTDNTGNGS